MNKRTVSIIRELGNVEKEMTIKGLAESFGVSQRTIRNDLNTINDALRENGLQEVILKRGGIIIRKADFPEVLNFVMQDDFYRYKLSKEERKRLAAVLLAINSRDRKDGNTAILIKQVFEELNKEGIETEMIQLAGQGHRAM